MLFELFIYPGPYPCPSSYFPTIFSFFRTGTFPRSLEPGASQASGRLQASLSQCLFPHFRSHNFHQTGVRIPVWKLVQRQYGIYKIYSNNNYATFSDVVNSQVICCPNTSLISFCTKGLNLEFSQSAVKLLSAAITALCGFKEISLVPESHVSKLALVI